VLSLLGAHNWQSIAELDAAAVALFATTQLFLIGQDLYLYLFVNGSHLEFTPHLTSVSTPLYGFSPVPPAWSLSLEVYFYLLAPFLVRRGPHVIAGLIVLSLALRIGLQVAFGLDGNPWSFRFFPSELALCLAGALAHSVYAATGEDERRNARRLLVAICILITTCLAVNWWIGPQRLASLALLAAVILGLPRLFDWTRDMAVDRYVGELSYPLYIGHFLMGWIFLPTSFTAAYLALAASLLLALTLYHLIDRPIDRWRQARLGREQTPAATQLRPSMQAG